MSTAFEAQRWLAGIGERRPLFCWPDGSGLTVSQLRDGVRLMMSALGLDASLFGAHSLRVGGTTAALAAGVGGVSGRLRFMAAAGHRRGPGEVRKWRRDMYVPPGLLVMLAGASWCSW